MGTHRIDVQRAKKAGTLAAPEIERLEDEVRDSYERHDRELSNPASRRLFEADRPSLDAAQREVLDMLQARGIAVLPFTNLFGADLWARLQAESRAFEERAEDVLGWRAQKTKKRVDDGAASRTKPAKKKFALVRAVDGGSVLPLDHPWLQLAASRRMLDIVNSYIGMWAKLSYVDEWYTPPGGSDAERLGSQRWHRDYNDRHLVKVFLYLDDVGAGSGPFEYVPGSAPGGPFDAEWPWAPLGDTYPDQEEFARRVPASATMTLTAPAGTLIFCNTSGFHRGGYVTERRRVIAVINYVSPAAVAALVERNFAVDPSGLADLPEPVRYALT